MNRFYAYLLLFSGIGLLWSCGEKDPIPSPEPLFTLHFQNDFEPLQAQFAAWVSDADGKVVGFRWLRPSDTSQLAIVGSDINQRYDCTVGKMTILNTAVGQDTTFELTTYQQLAHNAEIKLAPQGYYQITDLKVQFTNLTSLDTIVVPESNTFVRPEASNLYFGHYLTLHTGQIWLRLRVNGDPHWRYMVFNGVNSNSLTAQIDVNLLPVMQNNPTHIELPFSAIWNFEVQGITDMSQNKLLPIGDQERVPGGLVPAISSLNIFQPENVSFGQYRIQASGLSGSTADDYVYYYDDMVDALPSALPTPDFDITPTILGDDRQAAVFASGNFDALSVTRNNSGHPHLFWKAWINPNNGGGAILHRLPDIPQELGPLFPDLRIYNFGGVAQVRAERYDNLVGFDAVQQEWMTQTDPLWLPKNGFLAKEKRF